MYKKIYNPLLNKFVDVNDRIGRTTLQFYLSKFLSLNKKVGGTNSFHRSLGLEMEQEEQQEPPEQQEPQKQQEEQQEPPEPQDQQEELEEEQQQQEVLEEEAANELSTKNVRGERNDHTNPVEGSQTIAKEKKGMVNLENFFNQIR